MTTRSLGTHPGAALATDGAAHVTQATDLEGEDSAGTGGVTGRQWGGAVCEYIQRNADGIVKGSAGVLYGVICIADGVLVALYDNASAASGTVLFAGVAAGMTAGQYVFFPAGMRFTNGCYLDITGGTFNVLYH